MMVSDSDSNLLCEFLANTLCDESRVAVNGILLQRTAIRFVNCFDMTVYLPLLFVFSGKGRTEQLKSVI